MRAGVLSTATPGGHRKNSLKAAESQKRQKSKGELDRNTRRVFDTIHKLRDRGVDVEAAMNDFYRREGII